MHKKAFIIVAMLLHLATTAQLPPAGEQGIPFLKNFTSADYRAHAQNFDILRGERGLIYAGNFAGVLQYDGETWRLIPTSRTSRVSALGTDKEGNVYVGARSEIGILKADPYQGMVFQSLLDSIESKSYGFFEVSRIFELDNKIHFLTKKGIFIYAEGKVTFRKTEGDILDGFKVNGKIYLQMKDSGLVVFGNNSETSPVAGGGIFSGAIEIKGMLSYPGNRALIATSSQGLFLLDDAGIREFRTAADQLLTKNLVTCAVSLVNGSYAFGTFRQGIIILGPDGAVIQLIGKNAELADLNVQALYSDNNILWAALNNGIAMIATPARLTYFNDQSGLLGSVNKIIRHNGSLYAATFQGLFVFEKEQHSFRPIPEIISACWDLLPRGDHLMAATSRGLFRVGPSSVNLIKEGFVRSVVSSPSAANILYTGEIGGFYQLKDADGRREVTPILGNDADVTKLAVDGQGNIWGTLLSGGLFRYAPGTEKPVMMDSTSGLEDLQGISLNSTSHGLLIASRKGVYNFNYGTGRFEKRALAGNDSTELLEWFSFIIEGSNGNLWVNSGDETNIRLMKRSGNHFEPFLVHFLPVVDYAIWSVFQESNGISWLGGPNGIVRYNPEAVKVREEPFPTLIRKITLNVDSLFFEGSLTSNASMGSGRQVVFPYTANSVRFEFSTPFYAPTGRNQYQYRLEGFDETWSEWTVQTRKEYTNLPAGDYTFHVRGRNIFGMTSPEATFAFRVLSPWYATAWAYIFYFLAAGGIIYLIVVIRNRQLVAEKRKLEQRIAERTAEVVEQKEEIEKQSKELSQKNDELEKINNTVKSINSEIIFGNLLQTMLEKMRIIRSVERSSALVLDKETNLFRITASVGWDTAQFENVRMTLEQAENRYLKNAMEVHEDVFLKTEFPGWNEIAGMGRTEAPRAMIVLVIRVEQRVEAFLLLENMLKENAFEGRDLSFIRNSKEHIISAFIRTRLLQDLQNTLQNLKATQDQLIQSEKLASLGQLTAGIAHEIQNPLNFVNNFSSLSVELATELGEILTGLGDQVDEDKRADAEELIGMIKGNLTKINEHGKRAESIVKGMLQHSRGRTGEFEQVEINNMVAEYVNLAYHGMRAKDKSFNTSIKTQLDPAVGKASIIPQDLSRVILNIVNNACYALDEKTKKGMPGFSPEVVVSTKKAGEKIEIHIRDNGTGIPPHVLEKIFNPFFTTKPTGKGTGLGLSMSFDIVNQVHKGKLEVQSKEGEFTEFIITIPEKQ